MNVIQDQSFQDTIEFAIQMDGKDPLSSMRSRFHIPKQESGDEYIYLCGNSLGLQPQQAKLDIQEILEEWQELGVEGHFHAKKPWTKYHELLAAGMTDIVGAHESEIVIMNTLTVNLHLMLVSFYKPDGKRNKVCIEADAFPSDRFAIESQMRFNGLDPKECLLELKARPGEVCLRQEDIEETIKTKGEEIALILIGNTNYYTGQFFNMKKITEWGHNMGCMVGFDCAHAAGNVPLHFHDSGCDFAIWCTYKYLNAGPGSPAGVFIHERHHHNKSINRLEGWWGHQFESRFEMGNEFIPYPGAQGWQISNPPILSMAPLLTSIQLFAEAGMEQLREKSIKLTGYLEYLLQLLGSDVIQIITPSDPNHRGSQLSIKVANADKSLFEMITQKSVIVDWREPDVIRVAPAAMYNSFEDVFKFYLLLKSSISECINLK